MFLRNRRLARLDRGKRKRLLLYLATTLPLLAGIAIFYFWNQKAVLRIAGGENLHPTSKGSPRIEELQVPPDRILQGKIAPHERSPTLLALDRGMNDELARIGHVDGVDGVQPQVGS